jgi:membrane fusion protein (multidrug efflux system)
LGAAQGDYVAVVKGLKEGEKVVTTGVFKLRPKMAVVVDNSLAPEAKLAPEPANK